VPAAMLAEERGPMTFVGFLLLGVIAGAVAKLILPGRQGGWVSTVVLGVIGAVLGGFIGSRLFNRPLTGFFDLSSWVLAIIGALIVLVVWGFITGRGRGTD
jgi:uncharacterized membrane protein YeaQ/YmgE (transglycosylase-associated protein family)